MYDVPPASSRVATRFARRRLLQIATKNKEKNVTKTVCKIMLDVYAAALGHIAKLLCVCRCHSFFLFPPMRVLMFEITFLRYDDRLSHFGRLKHIMAHHQRKA